MGAIKGVAVYPYERSGTRGRTLVLQNIIQQGSQYKTTLKRKQLALCKQCSTMLNRITERTSE